MLKNYDARKTAKENELTFTLQSGDPYTPCFIYLWAALMTTKYEIVIKQLSLLNNVYEQQMLLNNPFGSVQMEKGKHTSAYALASNALNDNSDKVSDYDAHKSANIDELCFTLQSGDPYFVSLVELWAALITGNKSEYAIKQQQLLTIMGKEASTGNLFGKAQVQKGKIKKANSLADNIVAQTTNPDKPKLPKIDIREIPTSIKIDRSRDALLTDFGKATLADRYLLEGESYQDMFVRVATAYCDDEKHAQRLYDYMSKLWFMPATPVLSNGGAGRGLPISCFLNSVDDSLKSIVDTWNENVWLASKGGGIGTYWGNVRGLGEVIKKAGKSSGVVPFIKVMDSLTLAISQGSLRRGSAAVYTDVHHPEIEEFIEIRKASGDHNRRSLNLHHGLNITDEFMEAVRVGEDYNIISPATGKVIKTLDARKVWQKILDIRIQTGEPYLIFSDTVNRALCSYQQELGLKVQQSNLCAEITLTTGQDHLGKERTAVCCLSSVNATKYYEWSKDNNFIEDIMRFLDNVLQDFINRAPPEMHKAIYAAERERSVGLGLMGFHSLLQMKNIPFEGVMAKSWNNRLFKHIKEKADKASLKLAMERGACPDAKDREVMERFSHKLAVAPTASISIICGGTSAGIEPIPANIYTHKTLSGSFTVKNKALEELLKSKGINNHKTWTSILEEEGSVQHLEELSQHEKDVFKTSFELEQLWIINHAADRAPHICQAQSVNLFLPADIDKFDLHMLHWTAWEKGVKSLYYCRSKSLQRASFAGATDNPQNSEGLIMQEPEKYLDCDSCA